MGTSRTCLLVITIQLIYAISAQETDKRVPQGFLGMRGKKYDSEPSDHFYKRKPQFFIGVKGKKNIFDYLASAEEKRTPTGFVGMRGKKDEFYLPDYYPPSMDDMPKNLNFMPGSEDYMPKRGGSLIGQIDYSSNDEIRNTNNEFPLLNEFLYKYFQKLEPDADSTTELSTSSGEEEMTNEIDKRANIHQFFGVRGKKSLQNKRPYDLNFRGKFIGVRGKKDLKNSGPQEIRVLLPNGPWPKRKTQMGFVGMRGKKWFEDATLENERPN